MELNLNSAPSRGSFAAGVGRKVLAVPVAPPPIAQSLAGEVDEMVCLLSPADFQSVGFYYADFALNSDDEIVELLRKACSPVRGAIPGRGMRRGM